MLDAHMNQTLPPLYTGPFVPCRLLLSVNTHISTQPQPFTRMLRCWLDAAAELMMMRAPSPPRFFGATAPRGLGAVSAIASPISQ